MFLPPDVCFGISPPPLWPPKTQALGIQRVELVNVWLLSGVRVLYGKRRMCFFSKIHGSVGRGILGLYRWYAYIYIYNAFICNSYCRYCCSDLLWMDGLTWFWCDGFIWYHGDYLSLKKIHEITAKMDSCWEFPPWRSWSFLPQKKTCLILYDSMAKIQTCLPFKR